MITIQVHVQQKNTLVSNFVRICSAWPSVCIMLNKKTYVFYEVSSAATDLQSSLFNSLSPERF